MTREFELLFKQNKSVSGFFSSIQEKDYCCSSNTSTETVIEPEKVLDGEIIQGESSFNQAPVTGAVIPVDNNIGATVYDSTVNQNGSLMIKVTKLNKVI